MQITVMSKLFDLAFLSGDAFLGSVAEVKDNLCFQPGGGGGGYSLIRTSWDVRPARVFGIFVLNRVSFLGR